MEEIDRFRRQWQYDSFTGDLEITKGMDLLRDNRHKFLQERINVLHNPKLAAKVLEQDSKDMQAKMKKQREIEHKKAKLFGRRR